MKDWMTGEIPWTVQGLSDALDFTTRLAITPKDDWDLTPLPVTLDFEGQLKDETVFQFGPQLLRHMLDHCKGDRRLARAHAYRFFMTLEFLHYHAQAATGAGVIVFTGTNAILSDALLYVLATSPMSERIKRNGLPSTRFDTKVVIGAAVKIAEKR